MTCRNLEDYPPNSMRTFTGIYINLLEPEIDMINIKDIAHALSLVTRWGGHTTVFYSVAEHSLLVASLVPRQYRLAALLHDASEAYIMDIPKPAKRLLPDYQALEAKIQKVICEKYGAEYPVSSVVKWADKIALERDHKAFFRNEGPCPETLTPLKAEELFLAVFNSLISKRKVANGGQ